MTRHISFKPSFTLRPREFYGIRGWAGKPIHPLLTGFPIVAYVLAAAFDVVSLYGRSRSLDWAHDAFVASTWVMSAGFLVSILTALTGLLDWPATTRGTQVRRTVNAHATVMVTTTVLALLTELLRLGVWPGVQGTVPAITGLTVLVALLIVTGAWIGNDLVFEHGFRVEPARNTPAWEPSETDVLPGGQALDRRRWHWRPERRGGQGRSTTDGVADVPSLIRDLASLRDDGIITPQDFESKKLELLSRM